MKKTLFIASLLLITFSLFSEGLNLDAEYLKSSYPTIYEAVKERAIGEWEEDHTMILFEINRQSKALLECNDLLEYEVAIINRQIVEWCDYDIRDYEDFYLAPIDWAMVLFVSKNQIKARGNY